MAQLYMVLNRHEAEACEPMEAALNYIPEHLRGREFYCSWPYGEHGFMMLIEGDSAEEVVSGLPRELRAGTRAVALELLRLPE